MMYQYDGLYDCDLDIDDSMDEFLGCLSEEEKMLQEEENEFIKEHGYSSNLSRDMNSLLGLSDSYFL